MPVEQKQPRGMDDESGDCGGDCPDRQLQRRQEDIIAFEHLLDQDDGADREEDVLTEEEADIVGGRGIGLHLVAGFLVQLAPPFRRSHRHRRDERPHRLRMSCGGVQADGGDDLPIEQIEDEKSPGRRRLEAGNHSSGALLKAVAEGRLAGAGLDVTDPEPPAPDDPVLHTAGVFVVPHLGSASTVARAGMTRVCVENVVAALTGRRPPNCVNPEVLERAD